MLKLRYGYWRIFFACTLPLACFAGFCSFSGSVAAKSTPNKKDGGTADGAAAEGSGTAKSETAKSSQLFPWAVPGESAGANASGTGSATEASGTGSSNSSSNSAGSDAAGAAAAGANPANSNPAGTGSAGANSATTSPAEAASTSSQDESKLVAEAIEQARIEANRKRYPDAKLILKKALEASPRSIPLYSELFDISRKYKDFSSAAGSLEKIMEIDPSKEKELLVNYGKALFELQQYDKAATVLKKALGYGNELDEIHKTLIQIYVRRKDLPAALNEYKEYFKVKPNDGDMHWECANLIYGNGKGLKESLPEYKAASDSRPMDSYGHERYAYLLLCNKDYDASINAYVKAIKVAHTQDEALRLNQALKYARQAKQRSAGPPPPSTTTTPTK